MGWVLSLIATLFPATLKMRTECFPFSFTATEKSSVRLFENAISRERASVPFFIWMETPEQQFEKAIIELKAAGIF